MKDLKFRIWNGYEMVYNVMVGKFGAFYVNPGDKGDGLDPKDSACITPFNTKFSDETPIMQYLGIKDKNGNEIFEKDIMRGEFGTGLGGKSTKYKEFNFMVDTHNVELGYNSFIEMPKNYGNYRFHPYLGSCEIVGNLFTTPELLNKTA